MKPGYQTTEFWLALVAQAVPLAVLFGVIPHADQPAVTSGLTEAVQNVAAVIGSAVMVWKYISSRTLVKAGV